MNSSSPAWRVDLGTTPSRFFLRLSLALHGAALFALFQTGAGWALRLALGVVIIAAAALAWRAERRRTVILREAGEEWWLDNGRRRGMVRLRRSSVWRYLVVMEFAGDPEGRRWRERVVVWPDAVAPDDFRRLRVRLRCGPRPRPPVAAPSAHRLGKRAQKAA